MLLGSSGSGGGVRHRRVGGRSPGWAVSRRSADLSPFLLMYAATSMALPLRRNVLSLPIASLCCCKYSILATSAWRLFLKNFHCVSFVLYILGLQPLYQPRSRHIDFAKGVTTHDAQNPLCSSRIAITSCSVRHRSVSSTRRYMP